MEILATSVCFFLVARRSARPSSYDPEAVHAATGQEGRRK